MLNLSVSTQLPLLKRAEVNLQMLKFIFYGIKTITKDRSTNHILSELP